MMVVSAAAQSLRRPHKIGSRTVAAGVPEFLFRRHIMSELPQPTAALQDGPERPWGGLAACDGRRDLKRLAIPFGERLDFAHVNGSSCGFQFEVLTSGR